jgi:hypothetical protein
MEQPTEWLLNGPPWVEYRTRIDLLNQPEEHADVRKAHRAVLDHPQIAAIIAELGYWPGIVLKSHKSANHPLHKLAFLADVGLNKRDAGIPKIIENILEHRSDQGPFQIVANIHPRFGGTGEDQFTWMLCDAPLVVYALIKFGLRDRPEVQQAVDYLVSLLQENGWPCAADPALGKFRGPGKKTDPCPYANLVMLKLLALLPEYHETLSVRVGVETLLSLWEQRKEKKPYLFAMGTDYLKLKVPFVWYDILHVTEVLSQFPWVHRDKRFLEMVEIIRNKADGDGRFTAESVWMAWKDWDFGQKCEPSMWLTLLAHRMLQRIDLPVAI